MPGISPESRTAPTSSTESTSGRNLLLAVLVVLALLAVGLVVDWHRLSIDGLDGSLNDQVGYISVARRVADHGTLESGIIYPGLLRQQTRRNTLYMPGYYLVLGGVFKCFGYSAAIARIPSLVSFLLACWLTYWIASKLYPQRAAFFACALFAFFPLCLVYAFTAMSEMVLVLAGLIAFAIFLRVRDAARVWVAPLALALPIVFRETGVLLGVVMLVVLAGTTKQKRLRSVLICGALIGLVLAAMLLSPVGAGRPSLWKQNILVGRNYEVLYADAFALDHVSSRPADWAHAIRLKATNNLKSLYFSRQSADGFFELSAMWLLLSGLPLGLWLWFRRGDHFALGVSAGLGSLLIATLCFYSVWGYRGARVLLIFLPFVAILWSAALEPAIRSREKLACALPVLLCLLGTLTATHAIRSQAEVDEGARENTKFLESVVQGNDQLLASPFWLSLDFVNEHYPVRWSFVPANCETMRLLDQRYRIGTMVVPQDEATNPEFGRDRICGTDLRLIGQKTLNEDKFWVYRREAGR